MGQMPEISEAGRLSSCPASVWRDTGQCEADENGRDHQETEIGNHDQVGKRRDQRQLAERGKSYRGQTYEHQPLQRDQAQSTRLQYSRCGENQRGDGAERQPETRTQNTQTVHGETPDQGQAEQGTRPDRPPQGTGQKPQTQHQQSAPRGHAEPCQQCIAKRGQQCRQPGRIEWRNPGRERRNATPGKSGQEEHEASDQANMQAGNRHQVTGARIGQRLPLRPGYLLPGTDCQARKNAACGVGTKRLVDSRGNGTTQAQYWLFAGTPQQSVCLAADHRGRRTDAFTKEPRFFVEATGIERAPRRAQAQQQAPEFARPRMPRAHEPGDLYPRRYPHRRAARRARAFENKTDTSVTCGWQRRDDPRDIGNLAVQRFIKPIVQGCAGLQRGTRAPPQQRG